MKILTLLVFILLLMQQILLLSEAQCLIHEQTLCNRSNQNLSRVPAASSEHITGLDLSFNRLETITEDDFRAYASLRSLIVTHNQIQTVHRGAFDLLINLHRLDLSFNRLALLSAGWFQKLRSLCYLNLLGNAYTALGEGHLFHPLGKLKILHVGGPNLHSVRLRDFSGLGGIEELFLDGKNLQTYAGGSLRGIGPVRRVTLGLNAPFHGKPALVQDLLSDVMRPNTTLTFTDTLFITKDQILPLKVAFTGGAKGVVFQNCTMATEACMAVLNSMSLSDVSALALDDVKYILLPRGNITSIPDLDKLQDVFFRDVKVPRFYHFPALVFLRPLLKTVRRLSMLNCKVFAIPCAATMYLSRLEYLDVSGNFFSDIALSEMLCEGSGVLRSLNTINVSGNHLRTIHSGLFHKVQHLQNVDLSRNVFHKMPQTCYWPTGLRFLNLSSTYLTVVTPCIPESVRVLDLSHNDLTFFNLELPLLTDLFISGNKISTLPDGGLYPRLVSISIQNNNLQTFSSKDLSGYAELRSLRAAANTYVCSCDFVGFWTGDLRRNRVRITDELRWYVCGSPDTTRGQRVSDVRLSVFECHRVLSLTLLCTGILAALLLLVGLCHKFNVVWYLRMTWTWLKAKRKPKLRKGELEYDAFVSYSEMDSSWVEAHLVPELEHTQPRLRLCLHKRDFVPGWWITDNIMDAIEKSHKTLFVLSRHFVSSEWCKYELDYTHFRLFEQNDDAVVLVLLEPIDRSTIPRRFCQLRRVMNSRTYLEWPADDGDDRTARFWQSLRTTIARPVSEDAADNIAF